MSTPSQTPFGVLVSSEESAFKLPALFAHKHLGEDPDAASLGQFLEAHLHQHADSEALETGNPFSRERFSSLNARPVIGTCLNRLDHEGQSSLAQHLPNPQTRMGVKLRAIDHEIEQLGARLRLLRGLKQTPLEVRQSIRLLEQRSDALLSKRQKLMRQLRYGLASEAKTRQQRMAQKLVFAHEAVLESLFKITQRLGQLFRQMGNIVLRLRWCQKISRPIQKRLEAHDLTARMAIVQAGLEKQLHQPEASTETISALVAEYDRLSLQLGAVCA